MALGLEAHVCPEKPVSLTRSDQFHTWMGLEPPLVLGPPPTPKFPVRKVPS